MTKGGDWTQDTGRGSRTLMHVMVRMALTAPATVSWLILHGITAYYLLCAPVQRRCSRAYLQRVLKHRPRWRDQYRHLWTFACSLFDRVQLLAGSPHVFDVRIHYVDDETPELLDYPCLLLGAHVGNFELLRWLSKYHPLLAVRPLMYREQGQAVDEVLRQLNPEVFERIIEIGRVDSLLAAREALDQGESLALLGDRCPPQGRTCDAALLGDPIQLPEGPFRLARTLNVPVILCFGLRRGWRRYDVYLECFDADPQATSAQGNHPLGATAQAFADRLAHYCHDAPYNWFNFYDFWNELGTALSASPAHHDRPNR